MALGSLLDLYTERGIFAFDLLGLPSGLDTLISKIFFLTFILGFGVNLIKPSF
jgi:hypothetical protein